MDRLPTQLRISFVIMVFIILLLSSCSTVEKAKQTLDSSPIEAAKYCADKYPVKDSIIVKDSISFDTIYVGNETVFDTVYETRNDTVVQVVTKTPPPKVITKTITQVKEVYRENTAKVTQLTLSLETANKQIAVVQEDNKQKVDKIKDLKKERNKWRLYFFILLASTIAWRFRKGIFSLFK